MQIDGAAAYGGVFDLPVFDLYNLKVIVERPGEPHAPSVQVRSSIIGTGSAGRVSRTSLVMLVDSQIGSYWVLPRGGVLVHADKLLILFA